MSGYIDIKELCQTVSIPTVLNCISWQLKEKKQPVVIMPAGGLSEDQENGDLTSGNKSEENAQKAIPYYRRQSLGQFRKERLGSADREPGREVGRPTDIDKSRD